MRKILAILVITVGLIGLGLTAYLFISSGVSAATPPIQSQAVSSSAPYFDLAVDRPAADLILINQDGETVNLEEFRGSFVMVNFIYTSCRTVCPLLTANALQIQDELGDRFGSDVFFLSVTLDPEYDTPERLKTYAENYGADLSGWSFLTGEPTAVYQVLDDYMQTYEELAPQDIDHTALTVLIDPAGMERHRYWGAVFPPEMVVERIETLGRQGAIDAILSVADAPVPVTAEPQPSRPQWGDESFIGIDRNLDAVVVLQNPDQVRLWIALFERLNYIVVIPNWKVLNVIAN